MPAVPRVRDTLQVLPVSGTAGQHVVCDRHGVELFHLTADGVWILSQLDGLTSADEILLRFEERFDREMDKADLAAFLDGLGDAGCFLEQPRAVGALVYMQEQGVDWRGAVMDRRSAEDVPEADRRAGIARREEESVVTQWWDHAVFHLNEGHLEHALSVLVRMSDATPYDLRLREIARHLGFVIEAEKVPSLSEDRRDVSWEVFDAALADMLGSGVCPRCSTPFQVELGSQNRCSNCGASFSAWILANAPAGRRLGDPNAPPEAEA
ncbi:MAG: PqqD family peptide modification chaperone [Deltaproteobacteria bacterium]|nr:PqqD family peptide modification chaperone [Deltaproteobacteria bacterium]